MRYYIIAGEASGDMHGARLVEEILRKDPGAVIRGWGGDRMAAAGMDLVKHYRDLAFMGFAEVVMHLPEIMRNFSFAKADLARFRPDALVLIDYPGFNLRMSGFAHKLGIKVFYYISPQLWAWKASRVKTIRKYVDRMFVILPFEKEFYARYGYDVSWVGHPLVDITGDLSQTFDADAFRREWNLDDRPVVALLPGSRVMEIRKMLAVMAGVQTFFPGYRFVVAGAPSVEEAFYDETLSGTGIPYIKNRTYDLLRISHAALVTSGTATLETALFNVPQVVCYKGNHLSYLIARKLVKVPFISLVNLISGREIVKELIQDDLTPSALQRELGRILAEGEPRNDVLSGYRQLRDKLGLPGAASRVADEIMQYLHAKSV